MPVLILFNFVPDEGRLDRKRLYYFIIKVVGFTLDVCLLIQSLVGLIFSGIVDF